MKCPLFSIARAIAASKGEESYQDCGEEECAWWDDINGHCALIELNRMLWDINDTLKVLYDKMPHAG